MPRRAGSPLVAATGCAVLAVCFVVASTRLNGQSAQAVDARVAAWKGERVRLLPNDPRFTNLKSLGGDGSCVRRMPSRDSLPAQEYAGKQGTIVEATSTNGLNVAIAIELDGGERIAVSCSDLPAIGFSREVEFARQLVGKDVWARGELGLTPAEDFALDFGRRRSVAIGNIERLTVTSAEWGFDRLPVYLCLKTPDGREGCLGPQEIGNTSRYHIDGRFERGVSVPLARLLHTADPAMQQPKWTPAVWKQIKAGQVAVGMSEAMAAMACGQEMVPRGVETDPKGRNLTIYNCLGRGPRFAVSGGKVVQIVGR